MLFCYVFCMCLSIRFLFPFHFATIADMFLEVFSIAWMWEGASWKRCLNSGLAPSRVERTTKFRVLCVSTRITAVSRSIPPFSRSISSDNARPRK